MNEVSRLDPAARDHPLRRDVRRLGNLLGCVLREQAALAIFEKEGEIRNPTKDLRRSFSLEREAAAARITEELDLLTANQIIRAFTAFLQLVNVTEQIHDIRKLRYDQLVTPGIPRPGSLEHAVADGKAAGLSAEALQALLCELDVTLVLTAHPTEAKRRTILAKTRRSSHHLAALDHPLLTLHEQENLEAEILTEITTTWYSEEVRLRPPTVEDEVRNGLFYFDEILWEVLPLLYRDLRRALARHYPGVPDWHPLNDGANSTCANASHPVPQKHCPGHRRGRSGHMASKSLACPTGEVSVEVATHQRRTGLPTRARCIPIREAETVSSITGTTSGRIRPVSRWSSQTSRAKSRFAIRNV